MIGDLRIMDQFRPFLRRKMCFETQIRISHKIGESFPQFLRVVRDVEESALEQFEMDVVAIRTDRAIYPGGIFVLPDKFQTPIQSFFEFLVRSQSFHDLFPSSFLLLLLLRCYLFHEKNSFYFFWFF